MKHEFGNKEGFTRPTNYAKHHKRPENLGFLSRSINVSFFLCERKQHDMEHLYTIRLQWRMSKHHTLSPTFRIFILRLVMNDELISHKKETVGLRLVRIGHHFLN